MKFDKSLIGTGLLAAFTASLCCITPVLAMLAGVSGLASAFSWMEPLRPYLVGLTITVLAFAWYQKLRPQKQINCECDSDEKPKFIRTKLFLGMVTGIALLMLSFPYYAQIFYTQTERKVLVVDKSDVQTIELTISGMTCNACAEHVNHAINKLDGIISSAVSCEKGNALISFDNTKISIDEIQKSINSTGYKVTGKKGK